MRASQEPLSSCNKNLLHPHADSKHHSDDAVAVCDMYLLCLGVSGCFPLVIQYIIALCGCRRGRQVTKVKV